MVTRILTATLLLPVLIFFVMFGGIYLQVGILGLATVGAIELYRAFFKKLNPINYIGIVFGIIYIVALDFFTYERFNSLIILFGMTLLTILVFKYPKITINDVLVTFFGFFYVYFFVSYIYIIREQEFGNIYVWLIFISAWACDTGAYFTGTLIGKRKFIPNLSPNKTLEGAIGGIVFAGLGGFVYGIFIESHTSIDIPTSVPLFFTIVTALGAVFAQIGDLTASAIKRFTDIKDYGKIFPGHGGVLDRFDSVIFTAPLIHVCLTALKALIYFFTEYQSF